MKKKFLALYALVGALVASPVFTSCIDSEESPTVTSIRNANAEKQKALAALASAQAEAEALLAKAQAALFEAEAQAQLALAKKYEAETAMQEIKNEAERAKLEVAKKEAERDLAKVKAEIEKQALEIETALLNAQRNLLIAQESLKSTIEQYEEDKVAELQTLTNNYTYLMGQLLGAKRDLAGLNVELIKLQSGFTNAQTALEKTILEKNNQIALNNVKIEAYKASANYTEDLETLKAEHAALEIEKNDAYKKNNDAQNKFNNANPDMNAEAVVKAAMAIVTDDFYKIAINRDNGGYWDENNSWISFNNVNVNSYITNATEFDGNSYSTSSNNINNSGYEFTGALNTIGNEDGYFSTEYTHKDFYKTTLGHELAFAYETGDLTQFELSIADLNATDEANLETAQTALETAETTLETAQTAEEAAKKAWEEAAEADKAAKRTAYDAAIQDRIDAENDVTTKTTAVENLEKAIEARNNILAICKKGDAELQKKIAAYNEAVKAEYAEQVTVWPEMIDAQIAYNEIETKYNALNNILNDYLTGAGANNIANQIKQLEANNVNLAKEIEEAKLLLTGSGWNGYSDTYEATIEWTKGQIIVQEAEIATLEIALAAAKAELDAALEAVAEEEEAE